MPLSPGSFCIWTLVKCAVCPPQWQGETEGEYHFCLCNVGNERKRNRNLVIPPEVPSGAGYQRVHGPKARCKHTHIHTHLGGNA